MRIEITVEGQEPVTHKLVKEKTLLGAGTDCDVIVEAEGMSRKHVIIVADGDQFFVVDQGSTNGVFIDEERLVPGQRASFTSFFPVRLGAHVTIALLSDEEAGLSSFDFAKELPSSAEKKSSSKTTSGMPAGDSKASPQVRAGSSPSLAAPARRPAKGEVVGEKRKSQAGAQRDQTNIVKIMAFIVAFGGSALFFYFKSDGTEDQAAQPVVVAKVELPPVNLSSFEIVPKAPVGVTSAPNALNELKCSTQEELGLCRGLGLPVKTHTLSGAVFALDYITVVLPAFSAEEALSFFEKDSSWDEAAKLKMQNLTDPRDFIAMFVVSSPLDAWARLTAEKRWLYVIFVTSNGTRVGDLWVADLSYLKSLATRSEEFFNMQTSFRAQGPDATAPLAGLFRRVPEPEAPAATP